jgi:hypothetical protein
MSQTEKALINQIITDEATFQNVLSIIQNVGIHILELLLTNLNFIERKLILFQLQTE